MNGSHSQIGTDITVTSNTQWSLPTPTWGACAIPFLMRTGLCGGGKSRGCFCQLCWSLPGCWYTPQQWLQRLFKTSAEATMITGWLSRFTKGVIQKAKGYHHYVAGELKGYKTEGPNTSWIQSEKNPSGRKSHKLFRYASCANKQPVLFLTKGHLIHFPTYNFYSDYLCFHGELEFWDTL